VTDIILLDSGPLSKLTHPRIDGEITDWFMRLQKSGFDVRVPEICDYEVRRELIRLPSTKSVQRLDELSNTLGYVAITTDAMRLAARFWAEARDRGRQTAHDKALDVDMILSAQAVSLGADGDPVVIATENVGHLSLFAAARHWRDICAGG
jgi:hypothetical protein